MFTRVKKRKPRASTSKTPTVDDAPPTTTPAAPIFPPKLPLRDVDENAEPVKKRRNKMSFSTPGRKTEEPVRRSKRLSAEDEEFRATSKPAKRPKGHESKSEPAAEVQAKAKETHKKPQRQDRTPAPAPSSVEVPADDHSGTKISLPFADTPVIRRNKAMREGKPGKGERRSSLGLRGRRASSLIETGNSTALPHQEVEIPDFYKHIESEGLPEPRRMRQLLTWCATRALGERSTGGEFEDQSARMAARVIQEELLKDLANRSEMSDWFSREDAPAPSKPLQTRPNPKNEQNAEKIKELEEQIKKLRADRDSLKSLSTPPAIPKTEEIIPDPDATEFDHSLLSIEDAALLESLQTSSNATTHIQSRLNSISTSIGPMMDSFADGVHTIGQYRDAADSLAGRALAICAEKLAEKENQGRPNVQEGRPSPGTQLENVLRSLSRVER
jgi:kinetochore protein Mis13/DSN1